MNVEKNSMNKEQREGEIEDAINLLISILEDMDYDISRIVEEDNPDYIDTLKEVIKENNK